jgi:hypothetical protein
MALGTVDPVCWQLRGDVDTARHIAASSEIEDDGQFRVSGCVGGSPDGNGEAVFSRVLRYQAGKEALAVVDDQVPRDVERPYGGYG